MKLYLFSSLLFNIINAFRLNNHVEKYSFSGYTRHFWLHRTRHSRINSIFRNCVNTNDNIYSNFNSNYEYSTDFLNIVNNQLELMYHLCNNKDDNSKHLVELYVAAMNNLDNQDSDDKDNEFDGRYLQLCASYPSSPTPPPPFFRFDLFILIL